MTITKVKKWLNRLSNYSKANFIYFSIAKGSVMISFEFLQVPERVEVPKSMLKNLWRLAGFIDSFDGYSNELTIRGDEIEIGHKYKKGTSTESYFIDSDSFKEFLERATNEAVFKNSLVEHAEKYDYDGDEIC